MVEGIYPFLKVSLVLHVVKFIHFVGLSFLQRDALKNEKGLADNPLQISWQQLPAHQFQGLVKQLKQTQLNQR